MNLKVTNDGAAIQIHSPYEGYGITVFFCDEHRCETKGFPDREKAIDFLVDLFNAEYTRFGYLTPLVQCIIDVAKTLGDERLIDAVLDLEAELTLEDLG